MLPNYVHCTDVLAMASVPSGFELIDHMTSKSPESSDVHVETKSSNKSVIITQVIRYEGIVTTMLALAPFILSLLSLIIC